MTTPDDRPELGELCWLQVHDSAFPSGRFAHSHGLEAWLAAHPAAAEPQIAELVRTYLRTSVATLDAAAVAHAWSSPDLADQLALDHRVDTLKLSASARTAARSCGRQLALIARSALPPAADLEYLRLAASGSVPGNQPVVEGVLQRALGIGRRHAVLGHLRSAYANLLSSAVRLGRAGPVWAQRVLFTDRALLTDLTDQALTSALDELTSCTPELEIYAIRHESATARLFTT